MGCCFYVAGDHTLAADELEGDAQQLESESEWHMDAHDPLVDPVVAFSLDGYYLAFFRVCQ